MDIMTKIMSYQIRQKTFDFNSTLVNVLKLQQSCSVQNSHKMVLKIVISTLTFFANVPFSSQAYFMIDPKGGGQYDPLTRTGLEEFWTHL